MKAPTKADKDRLNRVSQLPCIVCWLHYSLETPAEVHHRTDTGRRVGHQDTFPLCFPHHRQGINTPVCVSRHPFKKEFERRYGTEQYLLEETNKLMDCYV